MADTKEFGAEVVRDDFVPKADFIDLRKQLNCVPCWRNEAVHCLASGDFTSLCMKSIEVGSIATTIQQKLNGAHLN